MILEHSRAVSGWKIFKKLIFCFLKFLRILTRQDPMLVVDASAAMKMTILEDRNSERKFHRKSFS
jgi:hypothetical protein